MVGEIDMRFKMNFPFSGQRPDLLAQAVESVRAIGNVHVWYSGCAKPDIKNAEVRQLPPLSYTGVHNHILQYGINDHDDVAFVMHADGLAKPGIARMLCQFVEAHLGKKWGIVLTNWDVLCAFNLAAIKEVGFYDPMFFFYMSDLDMYRRLRIAGWEQIEVGSEGVAHHKESNAAVAPFKSDVGASSIKADPLFNHVIQWRNNTGFDAAYYRFKWGGDPERETFSRPFEDFLSCQPNPLPSS
jgi:hypothetical protein